MSLGLSLANTLQGLDVNTLMQALEQSKQQVVADSAARAAQAGQGAEQAGMAYQTASEAPPPQLSALAQSLGPLLGNVASVISGNQNYGQAATEKAQISQAELIKNRMNTLQALRDKYLQQSEAARQLGNEAAHTESLVKLNQIESQQSQLMQKQKQDFEAEQNRLQEQGLMDRAKLVAGAKAAKESEGINYDELVKGIDEGSIPVPQSRGFTGNYAKLLTSARKAGVNINAILFKQRSYERHYASLNSASQLRLRQALNTAIPSLDVISEYSKDLATKIPRGAFTTLNRKVINAAADGKFGPGPQASARQLLGEIGLVRGEIAQVMRGGHAPTNEAFKEVRDLLDAGWNEQGLDVAVKNAKRNLNIRASAIENTGALAGQTDRGFNPTSGAQPTERYDPTTGQFVRIGP